MRHMSFHVGRQLGRGQMLDNLKRGLSAFGVHSLFYGMQALGQMPMPRELYATRRHQDIAYHTSGLDAHLLDIWMPEGQEGQQPTVFFVHGGGFEMMSKDTHWMMAKAFASAGYGVVTINYRLGAAHPYPAPLQDAARALGWVMRHGASYGLDTTRLIFAGESAGANLVTALTLACVERMEPSWAQDVFDLGVVPEVLLPAYGVQEVSRPQRYSYLKRGPIGRIAYQQIERCREVYLSGEDQPAGSLADPLSILEQRESFTRALPPMFTFAGGDDPLREDARRLQRAWDAHGARADLQIYKGANHGFHAFLWSKPAQDAWKDALAFLDEQLALISLPNLHTRSRAA